MRDSDQTRATTPGDDPTPATNPTTQVDPLLQAVQAAPAPSGARSRVLRTAEEVAQRSTPAPVEAGYDVDARRRREAARAAALEAKPVMPRVVQAVIALLFPFLLVIGALRLVASPWFLWLEYHRPGFPADAFGWDTALRLTYGSYGVDYLSNAAGPDYLGSLVDGGGQALFLPAEVQHMADVKAVMATLFAIGLILLGVLLVGLAYLSKTYAGGTRRALFAGSLMTVLLAALLALAAFINWSSFFTWVHSLFFADGTWTFRYEDALIRLYPEQFWIDAALAVGALVVVAVVVTLVSTWPTKARRERSRATAAGRRG